MRSGSRENFGSGSSVCLWRRLGLFVAEESELQQRAWGGDVTCNLWSGSAILHDTNLAYFFVMAHLRTWSYLATDPCGRLFGIDRQVLCALCGKGSLLDECTQVGDVCSGEVMTLTVSAQASVVFVFSAACVDLVGS